jgi:hypothetical protein
MDKTTALSMVKARLNRLDDLLDTYLTERIDAAVTDLTRAGITLNDSVADLMLVVDTVCWDYANRDQNAGMPDWLKLRRRERWLQQHAINKGAVE